MHQMQCQHLPPKCYFSRGKREPHTDEEVQNKEHPFTNPDEQEAIS
jgi:hypothetical protein